MSNDNSVLKIILENITSPERANRLFQIIKIPQGLIEETGDMISRAGVAQVLNMLLFEDLLSRVPDANKYVEDCLRHGKQVMHDHGAVRTVALSGMGSMPAGEEAMTRILSPLGYGLNGVYPLERLKMTGRSYAQAEYPEDIAQYFISELHPERFSSEFRAAVARVTATSSDPLTAEAKKLLAELEQKRTLSLENASKLLLVIGLAFRRQHSEVSLADYQILLAESAEMAWISTEGNSFNHATDRVEDVDALAAEQKSLGRAMKATVETSQSGRVRQTAFLAARVQRRFYDEQGEFVELEIPGSFYEFITRLPLPTEKGDTRLDLGFDSSNAQAIFRMTAGTNGLR